MSSAAVPGRPFVVKRARIEMVPLIDMFFLLLVFFIYGVFSMSYQEGLTVELPSARSTTALPREQPLTVSVRADGALFLNREPVDQAMLASALQRRSREQPETPVIINADRRATHGVVITVLDAVRQAGLQRVSLTAEPAPP